MNRATDGFNTFNEGADGPSRRPSSCLPPTPASATATSLAAASYWAGEGQVAGDGVAAGVRPRRQAAGRHARALSLWRQVVEAEPLAIDGHQNVAQLLAETEGRAAAWRLEAAADRFPHCDPLLRLLIEFVREPAPRPSRSSAG